MRRGDNLIHEDKLNKTVEHAGGKCGSLAPHRATIINNDITEANGMFNNITEGHHEINIRRSSRTQGPMLHLWTYDNSCH